MRLLNVKTLELSQFFDHNTPPYSILSHTWGDQEVTFQDIQDDVQSAAEKKGFVKIVDCCRRAERDLYEWVWIDTCCIDKSSSAELSEAINSMYKLYEKSGMCYAYLQDVSSKWSSDHEASLRNARWFGRGWTLQELIAPRFVEFYASDWSSIGSKSSLSDILVSITGINYHPLRGMGLQDLTVAEKMSWAAWRTTTREEDRAYSLLGIFNINMPLLYGEGRNAFSRLQEHIIRQTEDYTILLSGIQGTSYTTILAQDPDYFNKAGLLVAHAADSTREVRKEPWSLVRSEIKREDHRVVGFDWKIANPFPDSPLDFEPPRISSRGLHITLLAKWENSLLVAWTSCWVTGVEKAICMELESLEAFGEGLLKRGPLRYLSPKSMQDFEWLQLCLRVSWGSELRRRVYAPETGHFVELITVPGVSLAGNLAGRRPLLPDRQTRLSQRAGEESTEG